MIEISEESKGNELTTSEWFAEKRKEVDGWLDAKSEIYSRIAEFDITRRTVIRVNLITACLIVVAVAVEQNPIVAVMAAVSAGYLVRRLK